MSNSTRTVSHPNPRPEIETAFVAGEAVLLDVTNGAVYALNPSASAVWVLMDGDRRRPTSPDLSDIVEVTGRCTGCGR